MSTTRPFLWILLALLPALGACGAQDVPLGGPPTANATLDADRWLGEAVDVENLVVWPVYTRNPLDLGEFVTLEEAEKAGSARVREVGGTEGGQERSRQHVQIAQVEEVIETEAEDEATSEPAGQVSANDMDVEDVQQRQQHFDVAFANSGPTVGTLVIENDGDVPILIVAGTIVKGGQQDRQIAQDLVIAAHSEVPVEAFCVEPGRWNTRAGHDGVAFRNTGLGVAAKSVRIKAQYVKDQQEVWDEVREVLDKKGIEATSTLVAAVEDEDGESGAHRQRLESRVREYFAALARNEQKPVGFAYAVNGEIQSVRAFAHHRLLTDHLPSFVQAMALEADLARGEPAGKATAADVTAFVAALNAAQETVVSTRALNAVGLRQNDDGYNGSCYLPGEDGEEGNDARRAVTVDWSRK